jgi:hypothetical protein
MLHLNWQSNQQSHTVRLFARSNHTNCYVCYVSGAAYLPTIPSTRFMSPERSKLLMQLVTDEASMLGMEDIRGGMQTTADIRSYGPAKRRERGKA